VKSINDEKKNKPFRKIPRRILLPILIIMCSMPSIPANPSGVDMFDNGKNVIDPLTWWHLHLYMPDARCGSPVEIELLRPLSWIEEIGAEVGGIIYLIIDEIGIKGFAEVLAIKPCPPIEPGNGNVVTGRFASYSNQVLQITFEETEEPVQPTAGHQFYSLSRNSWIPASELEIGEQIRTQSGEATITSITPLPGLHKVYNLEIMGDHSYYVSREDVIAHNTGCNDPWIPSNPWNPTSQEVWTTRGYAEGRFGTRITSSGRGSRARLVGQLEIRKAGAPGDVLQIAEQAQAATYREAYHRGFIPEALEVDIYNLERRVNPSIFKDIQHRLVLTGFRRVETREGKVSTLFHKVLDEDPADYSGAFNIVLSP
jgi:hypothetical protein